MSDTVQIWLDKDEWYPVYGLMTEEGRYYTSGPFTVPTELVDRYAKSLADFEAVQDELGAIYSGEVAGGE